MAVDLKIEAFSNEFFDSMWEILYGVLAFGKPRQISGMSTLPETSELSSEITYAVTVRMNLFQFNQFERDYYEFSKSGIDFYRYVKVYCDKLSNNLHIFDKFLSVCSIVLKMGRNCLTFGSGMYIDIAPLCCAMYIDSHLKDEFYDAGGWNELKRHASTYRNVLNGVELGVNDVQNAFIAFRAASKNYNIDLLQDCFQKRWKVIHERRQDMNLCSKCSLLSSAFTVLFSRKSLETGDNTIEYLLQLILYIQSLEKQTVDASNVSKEFRKLSVHSENSDQSDSDSKIKVCDQESDSLNSSSDSTETSTLKLFQKMFGDPCGNKPEDIDSAKSISKDSCPLCLSDAIEPLESSRKKKLENEKQVGLRIMKEIKLCNLEVSSEHFKSKNINPGNKTEIENASSDRQSENEENIQRKQMDYIYLRLFIALGTEPAKSRILSEFKSSSDVQSNKQAEPNTSNKRKKKPRKKKNTKTAETVF